VPDGYTLGLANTTSHVVSAALNPHLPFDPLRDFVPIGMIGSSPFMLVSSPHVPATTLQEFVDLAKAKPGSLSYASAGTGTLAHLAGELFKHQANIDLVHVPYHGTEQSVLDLMEGRIDLSVSTIPPTLPQIKQGNVRALAVMSDKRSGMLPDVPTVAEAGTPGCEAALWTAIVVPAGVPADIVDRLSKTLIAVVNDPDVQKTLAAQGVDPQPGPPDVVTATISADIPKWRSVVTNANIVQAQ
jgi:tripartite-type tricarboxylate transporter receptor subunit TctC